MRKYISLCLVFISTFCLMTGIVYAAGTEVLDMSFNDGTLNDASGYDNHGTAVNSVTYLPTGGHDGQGAYDLDGINSYIYILDSAELKPTTSFTVSAWINQDINSTCGPPNDNFVPFGKVNIGITGYMFYEECVSNSWGFTVYGLSPAGATMDSPNAIGTWKHFVGVYDSDNNKLKTYVDGQPKTTKDVTGTPAHDSSSLQLGRYSWGSSYFDGKIDDIKVFDGALNDAEVLALYSGGGGGGVPEFSDYIYILTVVIALGLMVKVVPKMKIYNNLN